MKILIIEDNPIIADTIRHNLNKRYIVDVANNGKKGLEMIFQNHYSLIILDLGLPDMKGEEICKKMRADDDKTPVVVLSGKSEVETKVEMLNIGADDYITKPFNFDELIARIDAATRRKNTKTASAIIEIDGIKLDSAKREVIRFDEKIKLRRKEYELLEYLVRNHGQVLTRTMILGQIWDAQDTLYANVVDVHIKYLRDKIDRPYKTNIIKTEHGLGYKLDISNS